jgi:adenylate cyclase
MANFDDLQKAIQTNLLIAFIDIARFVDVAKKFEGLELYDLMNGMAITAIRLIKKSPGRIVKFIGDSMLIIFPEESVDEGVLTILELKEAIIAYFKSYGLDIKLHVGVHVGEAIVGPYGEKPHKSIDVFGDSVNRAAILAGSAYKGKFVITPQAFRKLRPETRKKFHKFTQPIVYIAE